MEKELILENLSFTYPGNTVATIKNINLSIQKGSFTTILGPSGCGKTTLLRLIAGFTEPTQGRILLSGVDQKGVSPDKRGIGVVFQDYALFPHMTVRNNILYGLRIRKTPQEEAQNKVLKTAAELGLTDLLDRYPDQISGGQQQRTALARSLVLDPKVLLMDEPLSSLDTKLRAKVRQDLKEIQQKLGITTVYVTHDTEEAMFLSDTVAVLSEGKLIQTASPRELYLNPNTASVAQFAGKANILDGFVVRPEWLEPVQTAEEGTITGQVVSVSFMGASTEVTVTTPNGEAVTASLSTIKMSPVKTGDTLILKITHKSRLNG